jgi:hypothetical protein
MLGVQRLARVARPFGLAASLAGSSIAPLQCPRSHPVEHRVEDDPAEVLYLLADRFKAAGNAAARTETLRFLVARYPESRFAVAARQDLGEPPPGAAPPR